MPHVVDACGLGETLHPFSSFRYELITYFVKYRRLTAGVKEDNWPMVGLSLPGFGVLHLHVLATEKMAIFLETDCLAKRQLVFFQNSR